VVQEEVEKRVGRVWAIYFIMSAFPPTLLPFVKFLIDNIWLIFCALLSGGALLWPSLAARGSRVSLLQATQLLNQGRAVVVDVRDPKDFAIGHMREARNIPLKEFDKRIAELDKFKAKSVIVVCSSGMQSARATSKLKKAGFNEVFSLNGGMAAWQAQGLPVTK
jgi:rhodanese-related sulfurtransferase